MGSYLNPGNFSFRGSLRSKIYVDKSELIARTNEALCTEQKYICEAKIFRQFTGVCHRILRKHIQCGMRTIFLNGKNPRHISRIKTRRKSIWISYGYG